MTITSFWFLVLISLGAGVYYLLPKAWQWVELLLLSLIFYYYAAESWTILYLAVSTLTVYGAALAICRLRGTQKQRLCLWVLLLAITVNLVVWFVVKGKGLWGFFAAKLYDSTGLAAAQSLLGLELLAALGMGYYTLQLLGYLIDCYWENVEPQKNPLKLFLFAVYFPQLTTGPISRYAQLECLFEKHKLQYRNLAFGAQRILWGFFKKIVLAERVGILVAAIQQNPQSYTGFYSWIALFMYPLQMYADFSGCMDIVLGVSELFDIHLTENFKNPFFSRTSQEFWQRWHITLGAWAKDYVLYPLLKSKRMVRFGKFTKKKFGRKTGKFLVNAAAMFVLWMVMGIWHGGLRYIVGVSLWYWIILMLGELLSPWFVKLTAALHMKTDSFSWHLFQSVRTYLIYAIGASFFSLGISRSLALLKDAWNVLWVEGSANPWIFFDQSILQLGVTYGDLNLILLAVLLLVIVACLREKYTYARIWIEQQSFLFRWMIWIALFLLVLVYGKYGPGYSAAEFIYQGF